MPGNQPLTRAKRQKNDEYYTQLSDIEKELRFYKEHFSGKTVYCNCDDPYESNFFKYFAANFNAIGLQRLIATSYAGSPVCGEQLLLDDIHGLKPEPVRRTAYKIDIRHVDDFDGDGAIGLSDVEHLLKNDSNAGTPLNGTGDFRSDECISLLQKADVVVTNPPFSLFREYLAQLIEHGKSFLILGQQNAITYKEVFPLLKDGTMWLGVNNGGDKWFRVPDHYKNTAAGHSKWERGIQYHKLRSINWYTNLDHPKRHEKLILYKRYSPEEYPTYDNYDAINVSRVVDIPEDYDSAMGVPITFLAKHNPEQFEILNANDLRRSSDTPSKEHGLIKDKDAAINGKPTYVRIPIRRR